MDRTINTKFFTFRQNNSVGYFIINDYVARFVIIEARDANEAISKAIKITKNYSQSCPCCGKRWNLRVNDNDGTDEPMVFNTKIKEKEHKSDFGCETIIYYYNGQKEKLWYKSGN